MNRDIYMFKEVEVYRLTKFDTHKCYEFALKTRTQGSYPNEKYYTTNEFQYLGYYIILDFVLKIQKESLEKNI